MVWPSGGRGADGFGLAEPVGPCKVIRDGG
jgi:hypothetical protein